MYAVRDSCNPGFLQLCQAISKVLATTGPPLWFDPERRVDVASGTAPHSPEWWKAMGMRTMVPDGDSMTWDFETPGQQKHRSTITESQGRVLAKFWVGPTSHTFASQTHQVLKEALQGHLQQDCLFQVALACPPELKRWARDVFLLDGEQLTTALTMTSLFNKPPGVI